jgi:PAS domain S-box-containing protein
MSAPSNGREKGYSIGSEPSSESSRSTSIPFLKLLFSLNPLPTWLCDSDTLKFIEVNDTAIHKYGYSREEFLGMRLANIQIDTQSAKFLSILDGAVPLQVGIQELGEWQHRTKSGETIDVELFGALLEFPGTRAKLIVAQNITLRKRAERCFRDFLEFAPDAMVIVNKEGNITIVNSQTEKIFGYSRDELLGKSLGILLPEKFRQKHEGHVARFFETPRRRAMGQGQDLYGHRKDGTDFPVEISLSPIQTEDGMLISSTIRDVSERKRLTDELSRSNADLERFASTASHDLKEPLRTVTSYMQLLERTYADMLPEEAKQYVHFAVDGTKRMQALIDALLSYAHVAQAKVVLEPVDCGEILGLVMRDLRKSIEESGAVVKIGKLPILSADRMQLCQLFENLIGNAIKYRKENEPLRVEISCDKTQGEWRFRCSDNGIGFDMDYAARIFEPFRRLHGKGQYAGSGVGLAICKRILERHNGKIWAESAPGIGSTFYFTLPG